MPYDRSKLLALKGGPAANDIMPTLPTKALFDKDLSLRSPFPRRDSSSSHLSGSPSAQKDARVLHARTDYSQIKRPTPVKAKPSPSVFDLQLPQSDVPHSLKNFIHYPVFLNTN